MSQPQPAYEGDEPFIFVSYSHNDEADVLREITWLQEHGFNVWWDEGIGGGTHWRDELAQRINQCQLFLYYASPDSARSQVCRQELEYALTHDRIVLLSHLTGTELPEGIAPAGTNRQARSKKAFVTATISSMSCRCAMTSRIATASGKNLRVCKYEYSTECSSAGVLVARILAPTFKTSGPVEEPANW